MVSRRQFLSGSGAALLGAAMVKAGAASLPEAPTMAKAATQPPLVPPNGRPYTPVATLNGWTLPWRMKSGWKEFHLTAGRRARDGARHEREPVGLQRPVAARRSRPSKATRYASS